MSMDEEFNIRSIRDMYMLDTKYQCPSYWILNSICVKQHDSFCNLFRIALPLRSILAPQRASSCAYLWRAPCLCAKTTSAEILRQASGAKRRVVAKDIVGHALSFTNRRALLLRERSSNANRKSGVS